MEGRAPVAAPYSAAIVTFRRPASLALVVDGLRHQEHLPTMVVVADNDPLRSAEQTVAELSASCPFELAYLPVGSNLGPAGGWARAVDHLGGCSARGEWVAVFDDDDPITHPQVMRRLAARAAAVPSEVAGVGLRGARLRRWSASLHRVDPTGATGPGADYLASGGAPLYRWSAIEEVGFFDPDLFFGFEDLELGIRLRRRGLRLLVEDLGGLQPVADTAATRTAWREYFKTRALVAVCRRHLGTFPLSLTLLRALVLGTPRLLLAGGGLGLVRARWRGARDGLVGALGPGSAAPSANPSKPGRDT